MSSTLGQRLQQAREHRGLSLPDVAHQTRIPIHRLRELEEDNYNALGSVTYAKGHLRAYAELLGVDVNEVLEQMKTPPLGGVKNYRYLVESYGPLKAVSQSEHPAQDRTTVASGKSSFVTATVSAFCIMVVGGVLGSAFLGQQQEETPAASGEVVTAPSSTTPSVTELEANPGPPQAATAMSPAGESPKASPQIEVRTADPVVTPPKALPVNDEAPTPRRRKVSGVPKAQLVE